MNNELSQPEIQVLIKALITSSFYGVEADIAVGLVYKLTSMLNREKQ